MESMRKQAAAIGVSGRPVFGSFDAIVKWEAEVLKDLEDAENGLRYDGLTLTGWYGLGQEKVRGGFFSREQWITRAPNPVARAEYKKTNGTFTKRMNYSDPKGYSSPSAIELSSNLQVHKDGLGHLQFHLSIDRNPKYYVNIARIVCMLTYFGMYTGAMNIYDVEGRGTVSFVLGLTVITFKYSMQGENAPMPPVLLEETDLDDLMDVGFYVLTAIVLENMFFGYLLAFSGLASAGDYEGPTGNPNLFRDLSMDDLRFADLLFYLIIFLLWSYISFKFFYYRHWKMKRKQAKRSERERESAVPIDNSNKVAEYYQIGKTVENLETDHRVTTQAMKRLAKSTIGVTNQMKKDEGYLQSIIRPELAYEGDFKRRAIIEMSSYKDAGPLCQDFPVAMSEESVRRAHSSWEFAGSPAPSSKRKQAKDNERLIIPSWSDESTLEYLLFAIRAAHLPGTIYKAIALRLLARVHVAGPFDLGHTQEEVLGMIQYETRKKSDAMSACLMGFAKRNNLKTEFKHIAMPNPKATGFGSAEFARKYHHQGDYLPFFDKENKVFYPDERADPAESGAAGENSPKTFNALFGDLPGLQADEALIYFLTVLATYLGEKFDNDLSTLGRAPGVEMKAGVQPKTYQRINNKNATDYADNAHYGFKTGHTKDPMRNAFVVEDYQDVLENYKDDVRKLTPEQQIKKLREAIGNINLMWETMKKESGIGKSPYKVIAVKNNYTMDPSKVKAEYEGMHQLLVNIVYRPKVKTDAGTLRPMTFLDIFGLNEKTEKTFMQTKNGNTVQMTKRLLKDAFENAKKQNTAQSGGSHMADGAQYDAMRTLFDKMGAGLTVRDETIDPRSQRAFAKLMATEVALICETQIHLSWYFNRRRLTHLWFKANRAHTLSMLKYDSYGWFNRPNAKDFEKMLADKDNFKKFVGRPTDVDRPRRRKTADTIARKPSASARAAASQERPRTTYSLPAN